MIDLAAGLEIPDSAVTTSFALLAMKGAGKSNAAVRYAEQLYAASIPFVTIDPKGDWWGIRSAANGRGAGLPVPIFGGLHADVPIDPSAGVLFADLVVDQHLTCLIDVSELTKGESIRFLTAFFDRLYRRKSKSTYPMHLFLEECDDYVPQKVYREVALLVRTVELVVKRGRARGLGITLASQRAASINKDVLTQTDCLFALRNTSPQDRKSIEAWLSWHATSKEIAAELPTLQDGEAWVSWPQRGLLEHVKFHRRATFDSGATPELGEKVKPATLADIDVAAITAAVGDLVERAKADDPKALRAEIAQLRRQANAPAPAEIVREVERIVEIEVVPPGVGTALADALGAMDETLRTMTLSRAQIAEDLERMRAIARDRAQSSSRKADRNGSPRPAETATEQAVRPTAPAKAVPATGTETARNTARSRALDPNAIAADVGPGEQRILAVLARDEWATTLHLARCAIYARNGGGFRSAWKNLGERGYVEGDGGGFRFRGEVPAWVANVDLPDPLEAWCAKLPGGPERILRYLASVYPKAPTPGEIGEACQYAITGGGFRSAMKRLRSSELLDDGACALELAR